MSFRDHPIVRKARRGKVFTLLLGIFMLVAAVACLVAQDRIGQSKNFNKMNFGTAYNDELLDDDIFVYIDVVEEPYGIGTYNESKQFYYVDDGYDLYIIQCSEKEYQKIKDEVEENGSYEVVGTVAKLDEEVIDMAIKVYNEGEDDPEKIIDREDFDWYFQGVALNVNGLSKAEDNLMTAVILLVMIGIVVFIIGIVRTASFNHAFRYISEPDGQMVAVELDSPQTVYVKQAHTYLTPRFLVSLGSSCAVVPYSNIAWAYKFTQRYNFVPIFSNIRILTTGRRYMRVAQMGLFAPRKDQAYMTIFNAIAYYNPQVRLGYSTDNFNYFNYGPGSQMQYTYPNNNVNNNAV